MGKTYNIDDWNAKNLIIDGKHYDVNLYADEDYQVRIIIMECELDKDGYWYNNQKTIYDESFEVDVQVGITREDKEGLILEMWQEGWETGDFGDIMDELTGLHSGEKSLCNFTQEELDGEYERALKWKKDQEQE